MPFVFIFIGATLVTAGIRGKSQDLLNLLKGELWGPNNYAYWALSIFLIGALGYISDMRTFSRALLVLVLVVLVVAENKQGSGGLFVEFQAAVKQITGG
jgi:hypothetical protein